MLQLVDCYKIIVLYDLNQNFKEKTSKSIVPKNSILKFEIL